MSSPAREPAGGPGPPPVVATAQVDTPACSPAFCPTRRHSAPFVLSPADPLAGARREGSGARFWRVDGEESSDEEGNADSKWSPGSGGDTRFVRDAFRAGFTVDELKRTEALAANSSPEFGSTQCVAGHARHPRRLATRY